MRRTDDILPPDAERASSTDSNPLSAESEKSAVVSNVIALPHGSDLAEPSDGRSWWQRRKPRDKNAIATRRSVYDDVTIASLYQPRPDWENIHRFDPSARWTVGEELKVVWKVDWRILSWACIMFMALELDRSNISQAVSDNFLGDLGMDTNHMNMGNTIFRLTFLCAELPSQLVSKYLGPDRWIPMQLCLWSIVSAGQFFLSGKSSFYATRALLAIFQGGFIPDVILYLSYFYTATELSVRLAIFWVAYSAADIIGGFLGAGLLQLRGLHGYAGWRWLFLIEGLMTLLVGVFAWLLMPAGPTQTAGVLRGKQGWFNSREETIMVNRVIRDDPSKGDMHNRQPITPKLLWASLKDYDMWPLYVIGLAFQIPVVPPSQYFTINLRRLGFNVIITNLLTIPPAFVSACLLLLITYLSEKWNERSLTASIVQFWKLAFLIVLYLVDISKINQWLAYAVLALLLSSPSAHAIQVSWNSRNSNAVRLRTVSAAMYNMSVQASTVIAANVYQKDDAPRYVNGNRNLIACACMNICLYVLTKLYYVWRNKARDRVWDAMSSEQKKDYLEHTKDEGNKRLDFRFAH